MDATKLSKLERLGAIQDLPTGKAVKVSLQLQNVPPLARQDRQLFLEKEFSRVGSTVETKGAKIDLGSVSVSGQTVEAQIPVGSYEEIVKDLSEQEIRVDPLVVRQVVEP
jgi:hypothetical protein